MSVRVCNTCHTHLVSAIECPDCAPPTVQGASPGRVMLIAALLGLGMTGCGEKEDTGSSEPSTESEPAAEAMYGVAEDTNESD